MERNLHDLARRVARGKNHLRSLELLRHFILDAEGVHFAAELGDHAEHGVALLVDERGLEAQSVLAVVLDVGLADLLGADPLGPGIDDAVGRIVGVSVGPFEAGAAGTVHRAEIAGEVRNLTLTLFANRHVRTAIVLLENLGALDVLDLVVAHRRDHRLDELLGYRMLGAGGVLDFDGRLVELVAVDHIKRIGGIAERELLGFGFVNLLLLDGLNAEELCEEFGRISVAVERTGLRVGENRTAVFDHPVGDLLLDIHGDVVGVDEDDSLKALEPIAALADLAVGNERNVVAVGVEELIDAEEVVGTAVEDRGVGLLGHEVADCRVVYRDRLDGAAALGLGDEILELVDGAHVVGERGDLRTRSSSVEHVGHAELGKLADVGLLHAEASLAGHALGDVLPLRAGLELGGRCMDGAFADHWTELAVAERVVELPGRAVKVVGAVVVVTDHVRALLGDLARIFEVQRPPVHPHDRREVVGREVRGDVGALRIHLAVGASLLVDARSVGLGAEVAEIDEVRDGAVPFKLIGETLVAVDVLPVGRLNLFKRLVLGAPFLVEVFDGTVKVLEILAEALAARRTVVIHAALLPGRPPGPNLVGAGVGLEKLGYSNLVGLVAHIEKFLEGIREILRPGSIGTLSATNRLVARTDGLVGIEGILLGENLRVGVGRIDIAAERRAVEDGARLVGVEVRDLIARLGILVGAAPETVGRAILEIAHGIHEPAVALHELVRRTLGRIFDRGVEHHVRLVMGRSLEALGDDGLELDVRLLDRALRRIGLGIVGRPALGNREDVVADIHAALNVAGVAAQVDDVLAGILDADSNLRPDPSLGLTRAELAAGSVLVDPHVCDTVNKRVVYAFRVGVAEEKLKRRVHIFVAPVLDPECVVAGALDLYGELETLIVDTCLGDLESDGVSRLDDHLASSLIRTPRRALLRIGLVPRLLTLLQISVKLGATGFLPELGLGPHKIVVHKRNLVLGHSIRRRGVFGEHLVHVGDAYRLVLTRNKTRCSYRSR